MDISEAYGPRNAFFLQGRGRRIALLLLSFGGPSDLCLLGARDVRECTSKMDPAHHV